MISFSFGLRLHARHVKVIGMQVPFIQRFHTQFSICSLALFHLEHDTFPSQSHHFPTRSRTLFHRNHTTFPFGAGHFSIGIIPLSYSEQDTLPSKTHHFPNRSRTLFYLNHISFLFRAGHFTIVPAHHATQAGVIDSLESIPGLLKSTNSASELIKESVAGKTMEDGGEGPGHSPLYIISRCLY
jgi:hypothetical protein